jgi:ribosome-binding protein aMBF1 (putative translation factor)
MCLNFSEKQALSYLDDKGFKIGPATYYRLKNEVKESTHERLNLIASKEFLTQHMDRIDMLRTIEKEMWANYHLEKNPFKKVQILEKIEENQVYRSSYYDSTRYIMEQAVKIKQQEQEQEPNVDSTQGQTFTKVENSNIYIYISFLL